MNRKAPVSNAFVRACAEGRIDDVRRMIAEKVDVNQIDMGFEYVDGRHKGRRGDGYEPASFCQTGLQMAVRTKNMPLLKVLVEAGADPLYENDWMRTSAMGLAVCTGFLEAVRYIADEKGFPLQAWKHYDKDAPPDALLQSAISGGLSMVRYLVEEKGLDPCYVGPRNNRPLTYAMGHRVSLDVLEYLLQKNAEKGHSPNFDCKEVSVYKKVEVLDKVEEDAQKLTGDKGFSFKKLSHDIDQNTGTLLNKAVMGLDADRVALLLAYGANPHYKGGGERNAFDVLNSYYVERSDESEKKAAILEMLNAAVLMPSGAPKKKMGGRKLH